MDCRAAGDAALYIPLPLAGFRMPAGLGLPM